MKQCFKDNIHIKIILFTSFSKVIKYISPYWSI
nr:MAG TPA: hypothetical protein [Caudoviricetes sp.]